MALLATSDSGAERRLSNRSQRLFSQIERILRISQLQTITQEVVEAAREHLVVGSLP